MFRRIRLKARAIDDCEFGHKAVQFCARWAAQQVTDEQVVPCQLRDHAHINAVVRIRTSVEILHEIFAALHMCDHVGIEAIEGIHFHAGVVVPPDMRLDRRGRDNEFIFRRAARIFSRAD